MLHHFSYRAKVGERELEVQQKTKKSQNQTNPNCHRFDLVFSIKSNMLVCIRRKQKKNIYWFGSYSDWKNQSKSNQTEGIYTPENIIKYKITYPLLF